MESIHDEIRELEERLMRREVRASASELEGLISKGFVEFGSSGRVYDKDEIIAALVGEPAGLGTPLVIDFRALTLSSDAVLATYRAGLSLRSSVWRREDGVWRILFHQGTPTTGT